MTQTHTHCKRVDPQPYREGYRKRLITILAIALIASVMAQFTFEPHPYFAWDGNFWFYPSFGFFASLGFLLIAKLLGIVLKRRETYWKEKP